MNKLIQPTPEDVLRVSKGLGGLATIASARYNFPIAIVIGCGGLEGGAVLLGIHGVGSRSDLKKALRRALFSLDDPGALIGGPGAKGDA